MTPTRALVGLAAAAAIGYVAIHSVSSQGPQYVGDFPSIAGQSQSVSSPVTHVTPGPPVPDPPHYGAQPVAPVAPPAPPAGPAGPGPVGPAAPPGGGGTGSEGGYPQPGVPAPPSSPLPSLSNFLVGLPPFDPATVCKNGAGVVIALVPCDKLPAAGAPGAGVP